MEEAELIARCQRGELEGFEALYQMHVGRVLQTAYLITGNRALAEDVMQEAFMDTFRAIGSLRDPAAFTAWLYRITVNRARRTLARERRERGVGVQLHPGEAPRPDPEPDDAVWQAVERLPEEQRLAVVLYYFQDRPVQEIAAIMESPEGTVKSWLHRARARLSAELKREFAEEGAHHG